MKGTIWQLQEAKNKFCHVVDLAVKSGVQTITKHGKPEVVIVSVAEYEAKGNNLGVMGSLIAATAIFHGRTLVTRNTKHFPPEVPVLNPWL